MEMIEVLTLISGFIIVGGFLILPGGRAIDAVQRRGEAGIGSATRRPAQAVSSGFGSRCLTEPWATESPLS